MNRITTDQTIQYTKNLKILYAEDDLELQTQTKEFFEILFKSVTVANDGAQALDLYLNEHFDIIISDIKMPTMDGIQLTSEIKKVNPHQCIIIISAYNDSEYLLHFINHNIQQFIQKPINIDNMLETLFHASKSIVNEFLIEEYRTDLENTNKELISKNSELQSLVRILDSKLLQIAKTEDTKDKSVNLSKANIDTADLKELKELEIDISGAAVLISLSKNLTLSNIQVLGKMFKSYAKILTLNEEYQELSTNIDELGLSLENAPESFIKRVNDISTLLESFIYVLRMWRKNIVDNEIQKAFELHLSMINDIQTIITIVDGTENDIEGEIEFF